MSAPISVTNYTIPGMTTTAKVSLLEVSGSNVGSAYTNTINDIQSIVTPYPSTAAVQLTAAQKAQLENDINLLRLMLTNGYTPPNGGANEYLTQEMAQQLIFLFQSLSMAGVNINNQPITFTDLTQAQKWQDLVATSAILSTLFDYVTQGTNKSLQSFIELQYVKAGNDLLSSQLDSLQNALSVTQTSLSNLTAIQNLHNQIQINDVSSFTNNFDMTGTGLSVSSFQAAYASAASAFFGGPIVPGTTLAPTDPLLKYQVVSGFQTGVATTLFKPPSDATNEYNKLASALDNIGTAAVNYASVDTTTIGTGQTSVNTTHAFNGPIFAKWNASTNSFDLYPASASSGQINDGFLNPLFTNVSFSSNPPGQDFIFYGAYGQYTPNQTAIDRYGFQNVTTTITGNVSANTTFQISNIQVWMTTGNANPPTSGPTAPNTEDAGQRFLNDWTYYRIYLKPNLITLNGGSWGAWPLQAITNSTDPSVAYAISRFNTIVRDFGTQGLQTYTVFANQLTPTTSSTWLGYNPLTNSFKIDTRNPQTFIDAKNQLVALRASLSAQISALTPITPKLANGQDDPNTLLARLKQVMSDLRSVFVSNGHDITSATGVASSYSGFLNWLIDGYNQTTVKGGAFQQNITFAITAGQSLNDSQNESVRNFLFIFEEYYKSASAVLQQLTQILQRIAQNISR